MSTSKLQSLVSRVLYDEYPQYCVQENLRPEWLISSRGTRLELDFYVPLAHLAIEVQGKQHYVYVEHFHKTYSRFQQYLQDDQYKKDYCERHNILLIEVASESDIADVKSYLNSLNKDKSIDINIQKRIDQIHKDRFIMACSHLMGIYKGNIDIKDESEIHFTRFILEAEKDKNILPEWDFIVFLSQTFPNGERVGCLTRRWLKKNQANLVVRL